MDAYLKQEQIGTLFVLVGAPEGGFRGGRGVQPKNHTCLCNSFSWRLLFLPLPIKVRIDSTTTIVPFLYWEGIAAQKSFCCDWLCE
jgi:hypothetical protein